MVASCSLFGLFCLIVVFFLRLCGGCLRLCGGLFGCWLLVRVCVRSSFWGLFCSCSLFGFLFDCGGCFSTVFASLWLLFLRVCGFWWFLCFPL